MTTRKFIIKGVLPLILFGIITWLGQYIFMVDGSIDWFRFMLVYGVPVGIIITIYGYYYSNRHTVYQHKPEPVNRTVHHKYILSQPCNDSEQYEW